MKSIFSPYVLQCMRFRHESGTNSPTRIVMDYEFDFSVGCNREMWLEGKPYKIEKGCFVFRKPGQRVHTEGLYDCYMLTLDFSIRPPSPNYSRNAATEMQTEFEPCMWDMLPVVFQPAHYDDYVRIFEKLLSVNEPDINQNSNTRLLVNELLCLLFADAFRNASVAITTQKTPIAMVCTYIKSHYMEPIQLDTLAEIAHLNKNYLVRQFQKELGISPIAYLIKTRMNHARKLLTETDLPIKSIAIACGYSDPAFFNSYFKKTHGLTPLSFRNNFLKE